MGTMFTVYRLAELDEFAVQSALIELVVKQKTRPEDEENPAKSV